MARVGRPPRTRRVVGVTKAVARDTRRRPSHRSRILGSGLRLHIGNRRRSPKHLAHRLRAGRWSSGFLPADAPDASRSDPCRRSRRGDGGNPVVCHKANPGECPDPPIRHAFPKAVPLWWGAGETAMGAFCIWQGKVLQGPGMEAVMPGSCAACPAAMPEIRPLAPLGLFLGQQFARQREGSQRGAACLVGPRQDKGCGVERPSHCQPIGNRGP